LSLTFCSNIGDECVIKLAKSCTNLTYLSLGFTNVSDVGMNLVMDQCTRLQYVNASGCGKVSQNTKARFELLLTVEQMIRILMKFYNGLE